jgi:hypothetical protein
MAGTIPIATPWATATKAAQPATTKGGGGGGGGLQAGAGAGASSSAGNIEGGGRY